MNLKRLLVSVLACGLVLSTGVLATASDEFDYDTLVVANLGTKYSNVLAFSSNVTLAYIKDTNLIDILDTSGNIVFTFDAGIANDKEDYVGETFSHRYKLSSFYDGVAQVNAQKTTEELENNLPYGTLGGYYTYYINTSGETVEEPEGFFLDNYTVNAYSWSEGYQVIALDVDGNYQTSTAQQILWNGADPSTASGYDCYGYIDENGNIVVPQGVVIPNSQYAFNKLISESSYKFFSATPVSDGLGMVSIDFENAYYSTFVGTVNQGYGYMAMTGELVIPFYYDEATSFKDGYATVQKDGTWYIIRNPLTTIATTTTTTAVEEMVNTAEATASTVLVDGADTAFEAYNIADNNYFKLRDIAQILSGTEAQFEVTWDGNKQAINLVSGEVYTAVGGELETGDGTAKSYTANTSTIYLNGEEVSLTAYTINDNNYFKLRDLGEALGFNVSWDSEAQSIVIASDEAYTAD